MHKNQADYFKFFKVLFPHSVKGNSSSCNKLLLLILPQAIIGTLNDGWTVVDSTPFPTSSSIPPWIRLNAPDLPKKIVFPRDAFPSSSVSRHLNAERKLPYSLCVPIIPWRSKDVAIVTRT